MFIYILLPILLVFFLPFQKNKTAYGIVVLMLLLMNSMRAYTVGVDTVNYLFLNIEAGYLDRYETEPFSKYLMQNTPSNEFYLFAMGTLTIIPLALRVRNYCRPVLSLLFFVLLGFYTGGFNIARQMLGICIVFFGLPYVVEKKWLKFYICVAVAACFHNTAIIASVMPLIYTKLNMKNCFVFLSLSITYIVGVLFLSRLVLMLAPLIGDYSLYAEYVREGVFSLNRILLNIAFYIIYLCYDPQHRNNFYMKLFYVSIIGYNLLAFSGAANRIAMYFSISQIVVFANYEYVKAKCKLLFKLITYGYAIAYYTLIIRSDLGGVIPYEVNPVYTQSVSITLLCEILAVMIVFYIVDSHIHRHKELL